MNEIVASAKIDGITALVLTTLLVIAFYALVACIIYLLVKRLITYGINYYFDVLDYRAKEFAEVKERIRRAGLDADLRRINQELDEMENKKSNENE